MPTAHVSKEISAPSALAWEALADFSRIDRFHPGVATVDQLSSDDRGDQAVRRCNFHTGQSVVESVTDWSEGESFTVELTELNGLPMSRANATLSVVPAETGSIVSLALEFTPKYGPLGWLMAATIMPIMLKRQLGQVLDGLEYFLLTGEQIDKAIPELAAAKAA